MPFRGFKEEPSLSYRCYFSVCRLQYGKRQFDIVKRHLMLDFILLVEVWRLEKFKLASFTLGAARQTANGSYDGLTMGFLYFFSSSKRRNISMLSKQPEGPDRLKSLWSSEALQLPYYSPDLRRFFSTRVPIYMAECIVARTAREATRVVRISSKQHLLATRLHESE